MCNNYFPLNALYLWRQLYCAKNMIFDIEEKKKLPETEFLEFLAHWDYMYTGLLI